jgi:hypothetical protein
MGEMPNETAPRSRRALLAAAAGGAAALAAQAALPLSAVAADPNDVVLGTANASTAPTSIANSTDGSDGFAVTSVGLGIGVAGTSSGTAGVRGISVDGSGAATTTAMAYTGAYGWSPAFPDDTGVGVGVWGDSADWGVFGSGGVGVYGWGPNGVGVIGESGNTSTPAIIAFGATDSSPALQVNGKVKFNRAGRKTIGAGKSSLVVTMAGVTTTSKILAVLNSNRSGRYVRAVVAGSGKFTIYLNSSVSSSTYVAYFVYD